MKKSTSFATPLLYGLALGLVIGILYALTPTMPTQVYEGFSDGHDDDQHHLANEDLNPLAIPSRHSENRAITYSEVSKRNVDLDYMSNLTGLPISESKKRLTNPISMRV